MTCPRLHWTTDNPSGMYWCQFQHPCVLILNCTLALAIYIFVGLILMFWDRETHINPQRNRWIIVDPAGIKHLTSRLRQHRQLVIKGWLECELVFWIKQKRGFRETRASSATENEVGPNCVGQWSIKIVPWLCEISSIESTLPGFLRTQMVSSE